MRFSLALSGVLIHLAGFLAGTLVANEAIKVPLQTQREWDFPAAGIHFDCHFSGARLNGCEPAGPGAFTLFITPENEPINTSPWYAFKLTAKTNQIVTLAFSNTYTPHHGIPWLSQDGIKWERADKRQQIKASPTNLPAWRLTVGPQSLWVSAWDPASLPDIVAWTEAIAQKAGAAVQSAGDSIEGRPLRYFVLGEASATNYVFIIGRQHPPEITGTFGLESLVETVAGDSPLAQQFRQQFQTVILPVVNPDGVEHGHWRSNLGGVDLNRDWQSFSQPETRAVRDLIQRFARQPKAKPCLFLDFHSTGTNIFYAQPERPGDSWSGFTDRWLAGLQQRLPGFLFERDDSHNAELATGKAWVNGQFHIPAITCEFGYTTDRQLIQQAGQAEAEVMMQLLLAGESFRSGK